MIRQQDTEAELSYAYLHAVAAKAGVACMDANRAHDNSGIDATLHIINDFGPMALLSEISLHVQLKATIKPPTVRADGSLSYFLRNVDEYDRLRTRSSYPQRLLVVLFLPATTADWLSVTADQLVLMRAAYWVSLADAPASTNDSGQTVYLPSSQLLSPDGLVELFRRVAHREDLSYAG